MTSRKKAGHLHRWAQIDRAGAAQSVRIELGAACNLLDLDADYGLHILQQGYTLREDLRPSLTSYTALLMMHRAIDLLDGLSVLVKAGCVVSALPIVRCMFEAVMYARYLMVVNDERIAAACLVSQATSRTTRVVERASTHAPGSGPTIVGREFQKILKDMGDQSRLYGAARTELAALNKQSSVPVPWYMAFNGPRTLGGLSKRLDDEWLSELFDLSYDMLSEASHAGDVINALSEEGLESAETAAEMFVPLRSPERPHLVFVLDAGHSLFMKLIEYHMHYFHASPTRLEEYVRQEKVLGVTLAESKQLKDKRG